MKSAEGESARTMPVAGKRITASSLLVKWFKADMLASVLQDGFRNPGTLLQDGALAMSCDVDFGTVDLSSTFDVSSEEKNDIVRWMGIRPRLQVCLSFSFCLSCWRFYYASCPIGDVSA
jgi:hypothetical protein